MAYTIDLRSYYSDSESLLHTTTLFRVLEAALFSSPFKYTLALSDVLHVKKVRRKKNVTMGESGKPYLAHDDWIVFNNKVNDAIDAYKLKADVYSTPFDSKGKFWIRKGDKRRLRWDISLSTNGTIVLNPGTDDQFQKVGK